MMNGKGKVVRPDYVTIYYKRVPDGSAECARQGIGCVALPRGLKFVFGYNMIDPSKTPTGAAYFNCDGPTATPGHYPDIVEAAKNCPAGNRLGAIIVAPECWDGLHLDSADHRSHVAYPVDTHNGYIACPASHPYVIPTFTMAVWYTTDGDLDRSGTWTAGSTQTWHLSSDNMPGMAPMKPGTTFHSDWFGAWDDNIMALWMANCINKLLNCSAGDIGDGRQIKMFSGFSFNANPRVVSAPTQ
jgi:hypothetical protein